MLQPRKNLCFVAAFAVLVSLSQVSAGKQCPQGWFSYQTKCYFYSQSTAKWNTARDICATRGGVLATIGSVNEANFLIKQAKAIGGRKNYHIGITDSGSEGKWRNVDKTPMPKNLKGVWGARQPDNSRKAEHCGQISSHFQYKLNDSPCGSTANFLCERSIDYKDPCDSANGWHLVKDKCYKFFKEPTTWPEARKTCQDNEGDLLSVNSNEELGLVSESVSCDAITSLWLGYSDNNAAKTLQWVDGSKPSAALAKWDKKNGEPNAKNYAKGKNCAASITLNKNLWELVNCDGNDMSFVCEKPKGQCPTGWSNKQGTCIRTFYLRTTWSEAKAACAGYGGALATVEELKTITISAFWGNWLDISDRTTDGTYVKGDGTILPANQGQKSNGEVECVVYKGSRMTFDSCYSRNYYTCAASQGAVIATPTSAPLDNLVCYSGWTKYKGNCYKRFSQGLNYAAASADCKANQATLLVVNDQEEMDFLASDSLLLNSIVWIGFDDLKVNGKFQWVDGSPAQFTYWSKGEPNNDQNNEHCAEMQSKSFYKPAGWNDIPCSLSRSYICETQAVEGHRTTTPQPTRPWSQECGQGWTVDHLSGNCYFFSLESKSWLQARTDCKKMKSDLVSVDSKYEQSFIQGILRGDRSGAIAYWSGGNDRSAEEGWRWTDGKPFKFLNWNDGEPNSAGDEDCIEIVQLTGRWNDNKCASLRQYICERPSPVKTNSALSNTTPLPTINENCTSVELISGTHWVPDSAFSTSSDRDANSGPENSRLDWTAADVKIKISTDKQYKYRPAANLNLKNTKFVTFTVQACNDAHISLQPAVNNITSQAYEVVIGGWGNTQSVIRNEHQRAAQTTYKKDKLLDCNSPKSFWISWSTGKIQVGTGNRVLGSTKFMEYAVADSLTISGMAVTTGWGSSGEWIITNPHGSRKGAWSPKYSVRNVPIGTEQFIYGQWIQVDFAKPTLIQSVTTKGSATANEFVTEYYLEYSYDNVKSFEIYTKPGTNTPVYFPGNKNAAGAVTNTLEMPFEAQYVRLRPRKYISYPSIRWGLNGCPPPKYCEPERLVTGESQLADWTIKTSSLKDGSVYDTRLVALPGYKNAPNGWLAALPNSVANTLSEQWIQVYLGREMLVQGVVTKGHRLQAYWVKSYQIQTRSTVGGYRFYNYQEPYGTIKTFTANTDQDTEVTNMLGNPVIASYVRIIPKEYNVNIAMRMDILGCLAGCSLSPMLNGPNPLSNDRITVSGSLSSQLGPSRARLDTTGFGSAWVPKVHKVANGRPFIQVDFGITERISAITTQGRGDEDQWVTAYSFSYSLDGKTFYRYRGGQRFKANADRNTKKKNYLPMQIVARAIRVHPLQWKGRPAMRLELYGCAGSAAKSVGCYTEGSHADSFEGPTSYFSYNSPSKCAASCFKDGYMYAGLSRSTCKCGSALPIGGESKRCNYKCRGDNQFFCGGYSSGLVSVYETGIGPDDERCPVDYETYNGHCFKVSTAKQSWQDARASCLMDGGDLATINTDADQAYVRNKLARLPIGAWIGLNDLQDQMSFEWADGTPVLKTFWQHSEPNNFLGKREDCVEAISFKEMGAGYKGAKLASRNGWWNDRKCEESRYSICQRKKVKMDTPPTTAATPDGCPFGWKGRQSSCYLLLEHRVTWGLASDTCQKEGGTLVRVNDEFEQNFLTKQLYARDGYRYEKSATRYWTDLRYKSTTKEFVWSNDWDVIPFTFWTKNQPKLDGGNTTPNPRILFPSWASRTTCVAMNGKGEGNPGRWVTKSCSDGAFILCERPRLGFKQPPLPTLAPEDIPCPTGWIPIGPNCYQMNQPTDPLERKMWTDAEKHCVAQGAHLAYLNNGTENEFLWRNYILNPDSESSRYWIGLNDRASNQGYNWVSGDAFSFTNWKDGEPNDWDGLEPCVMLDGADGKWNDEKCHLLLNWICSTSRTNVDNIKQIRTTVEPTPGPTGSCPDGDDWKFFQGSCYYLNNKLQTYREATALCNGFGAHLVSIQSSIENRFVRVVSKSLITDLTHRTSKRDNIGGIFTQVWTGLNELDRSKGHRWSDGSGYKFSNWADNEPNDYNGGEYCVAMYASNGDWNDVHCSVRIPSVCEKNPKTVTPVTPTVPTLLDAYCPYGYMGFENDCYKIVTDKRMNWTSAEFTCGTEGGHLAFIRNSREQTFLTSQLNTAKKAGAALWLGLKHGSLTKVAFFKHADSYVWTSNEDVTYTNWNHGEPNGRDQEACTEMLFNPAGRWNDVSCDSERGYICRKPKDGTVKTPPSQDNSGCPSGYTKWEDSCYKYVNSKGTWNYLDSNVCGPDANLLSIQDPYEYAFVKTFMWKNKLTEDVWIGLNSPLNSNSFTWSNTWPVVVTYWGENEPANFRNQEGCVLMNTGYGEDDGKWKHTTCNEMHTAVCKKPLGGIPYPPAVTGVCRSAAGENWVPNSDGYCYLFNVDPRYTFEDAERACRSAGANLASLHSDTDTSFVTTQMEHLDVVGGNGGTKHVWIGLRKSDSGSFTWTDNSGVFYANWADNEPNSVESNEKCTELYSPNSDWNDVDCQSKRGFICKIKQGKQPSTFKTPINEPPTTTPTTEAPHTGPCQLRGWKYYNGSCYLMVSQSNEFLRWNEASDYCKAPGREANLVSVQSPSENQWIVENLLPTNVEGDAWIGLAELYTDNSLRWIDNSPITYNNLISQPKTNRGSMECVAMSISSGNGASGKWSTEYCFARKAFICKMDVNKKVQATVATPITDGRLCHFPFKYRGQEFSTCTTYGSSYLWCATTDHYEQDKKFAICDPFSCPPGWLRHERLCYYFSESYDKQTWEDAEKKCANMKADLAFIGNSAVQSFITDNINEYFWVGMNDRRIEGRFQWDHRPNMVVVRGFSNWAINEPRKGFGTEDCVQIVNGPHSDGRPGEWLTSNCVLSRRYICMKEATYTLAPSTTTTTTSTTTTPTTTTTTPTTTTTTAPITASTVNQTTVLSTKGGDVGGAQQQVAASAAPTGSNSSLGAGGITAIVIACLALVVAGVFIFLYVRKVKQDSTDSSFSKGIGFENASYSRSNDSVHVGLENPNFSAD